MPSAGLTTDLTATKTANKLSTNSQIPTQLNPQQQQDLNDWYDAQELQWLEREQYYSDRYLYDDLF